MGEFKQAVVVITGAAGNLGRAVAQCFAAEGAHLALLDRDTTGIGETISACHPPKSDSGPSTTAASGGRLIS